MKRHLLTGLFAILSLLTNWVGAANADSLLSRCENPSYTFDLAVDLFASPDFTVFQLEYEYGAKILVFVSIGTPSEIPTASWLITGRAAEAEEYCYLGLGNLIEPLASLHESSFPERFGMPGSGLDRCSKPEDPLGGVKVRAWAARELGDTFTLSLSPGDKGEGKFVLMLSKVDKSWIVLRTLESGETCYFDRGSYFETGSFSWEKND